MVLASLLVYLNLKSPLTTFHSVLSWLFATSLYQRFYLDLATLFLEVLLLINSDRKMVQKLLSKASYITKKLHFHILVNRN